MWYYNPFIVIPAFWFIMGTLSFITMCQLARKGHKKSARLFAVLFASSTSAGGFTMAIGWSLRNQDKIEKIFSLIN